MTENRSKWQTDELAAAFLQGVRGAIPAAGLQLEVINHIIRSWCPRPLHIVDLGCGDGALGRFLLEHNPESHVTFADFSDPMLEAARKQIGGHARATIVKTDFSSKAWLDSIGEQSPVDVVVSGFAIHHQPDRRKRELYREVFELLCKGGVFLNLEHVASATTNVESLFDNYFIDHLHRFHSAANAAKNRDEIAQDFYNRPDKAENILSPVQDQCAWLREIGFADVDCFFKVFELALFGGRKEYGR
ncbi:MAG: class I SAM-dependent methyltransferase [Pseudomonadota bacterium]